MERFTNEELLARIAAIENLPDYITRQDLVTRLNMLEGELARRRGELILNTFIFSLFTPPSPCCPDPFVSIVCVTFFCFRPSSR
jgi:hypothetical protein